MYDFFPYLCTTQQQSNPFNEASRTFPLVDGIQICMTPNQPEGFYTINFISDSNKVLYELPDYLVVYQRDGYEGVRLAAVGDIFTLPPDFPPVPVAYSITDGGTYEIRDKRDNSVLKTIGFRHFRPALWVE